MSDAEKPELRQANDNPWYCLATIYGEQPAGDEDREVSLKNYAAWNRWIGGGLSDEERAKFAKDFAERTSLRLPELTKDPDFSRTQFDRRVIFDHFQFSRTTDFSSATFSGDASFRKAVFSRDASARFHFARFAGRADFTDTRFYGNADFRSAIFSGKANFRLAQALDNIDFRSATFSDWADFQLAQIAYPDFRFATFSNYADFSKAMLSGKIIFSGVTFSGDADFGGTKFSGDSYFASTTFVEADFISARFLGEVNFQNATFSVGADFINAEFAAQTIFAGSRFEIAVPDFRGAKMHEATEWHGAIWPRRPHDSDNAQDQVYAYERLKQEMERLKKHEDEQMFFRRELRARRGLESPLSGAWLLNFLYEALSDYGQSICRPLVWILLCFAIGYFIFAGTHVFNGTHLTRARAATLSFANIFSFLPIKREIMTPAMIDGLSNWAQMIGVLQSLLGAVQLFLLGLALRNRFRMR
jgi:uncharacterized protein YjbI with pentapeptide repeats